MLQSLFSALSLLLSNIVQVPSREMGMMASNVCFRCPLESEVYVRIRHSNHVDLFKALSFLGLQNKSYARHEVMSKENFKASAICMY